VCYADVGASPPSGRDSSQIIWAGFFPASDTIPAQFDRWPILRRRHQPGGGGGDGERNASSRGLIRPTAFPSGSETTANRDPQKASYGSC
jgi:hypothetical protein